MTWTLAIVVALFLIGWMAYQFFKDFSKVGP